jgi:two-component system nitrogen regulation response regulator GlnG
LRERAGDVPELAHYFLFRFNEQLGLDYRAIAPEALEMLQQYSWPGNIRELQGVIEQAMLQSSGPVLTPELLPEELRRGAALAGLAASGEWPSAVRALLEPLLRTSAGNVYAQAVEALDQALIPCVLHVTNGHQTQAAELLGISRGTLRQKIKALNIAVEKPGPDGEEDDRDNL